MSPITENDTFVESGMALRGTSSSTVSLKSGLSRKSIKNPLLVYWVTPSGSTRS